MRRGTFSMIHQQPSNLRISRSRGFLRCAALFTFLIVGISGRSVAQEPQNALSLSAEQQSSISSFALSIRQEIRKEDCAGTGCEIMVVDFTLLSGETCSTCALLADSLAQTLSELPGGPNVISRTTLSSFLNEERIPSKILNQPEALAWVAHQLHASRLVFGTIRTENELLLARAHLLKDEGPGKKPHASKEISVKMPLGNLADGLLARESYHSLPKREPSQAQVLSTSSIQAKAPGGALPTCFYMPNPPYSDAARTAKLSGTILVEGIITTDGRVTSPRIIKGLPLGLNESSLEILQTWRCKPALQNGVPVSVLVPFEVTFRLY
jgi:TonB family protein